MSNHVIGLKNNWKQFSLLVLINGFVGGMVGLERTILPQIAEADFGIAAKTAILSFIIAFGISKAITNYYSGTFADRIGRKRLLVIGWLFGLPVPLILIYAGHWNWIIFANIILGINQGLTWSSTVIMKIDLAGPRNRGLAMGINESMGYLAVGAVAFISAWIAANYGARPYPFFLGIGFATLGLLSSIFLVRDTRSFVKMEAEVSKIKKLPNLFWGTSWKDRNLGSITVAGMVNNLNDGMIWGLLPIILALDGFDISDIGKIAALYPVIWGAGQLVTGRIADHVKKRAILFWGMLIQGLSIILFIYADLFWHFAGLSILLGIGTALVYPTFLAAIADHAHPDQRAGSIGVFRFWRDLGYALGALITGVLADTFGLDISILLIGIITIGAGLLVRARMN